MKHLTFKFLQKILIKNNSEIITLNPNLLNQQIYILRSILY